MLHLISYFSHLRFFHMNNFLKQSLIEDSCEKFGYHKGLYIKSLEMLNKTIHYKYIIDKHVSNIAQSQPFLVLMMFL